MAQTRATWSRRAGTENAGWEDHLVARRRERSDALRRGLHQGPLRRKLGRRSRNSSLLTRSSKCLLVNRFSQHSHSTGGLTNRDRVHRRHLHSTTVRCPLEQAVETLRFGAVDYHADPDPCHRAINAANPCALYRCRLRGHPTVFWQGGGVRHDPPLRREAHGSVVRERS